MKLYDIYYDKRDMDISVPLPKAPDDKTIYAVCVNWGKERLVPKNGEWHKENAIHALPTAKKR